MAYNCCTSVMINNSRNCENSNTNWTFSRLVSKFEYYANTKCQNTGTFLLRGEDHTMGSLIVSALRENNYVVFAGYRVRHPLEHEILVRVQTSHSTHHSVFKICPIGAMKTALDHISNRLEGL